MPRIARVVIPELSLHVTQRGINRAPCFFRDADYLAYLGYLREFSSRFGCSVHAYCLMTNHVHLFMTPRAADSCALVMKHLTQSYVQRINKAQGRTGTLWEGRYRSGLVRDTRYALACYRYIELNPVRAGMVPLPGEYPWSSYAHNVEGRHDSLVEWHPAYLSLAADEGARRQQYRGLFDEPLSSESVEEIRRATRRGSLVGTGARRRGRPRMVRE